MRTIHILATLLTVACVGPAAYAQRQPSYKVTILERPEGVDEIYMTGISNGRAVGFNNDRTLLWSIATGKADGIMPEGMISARMHGVSGDKQVGEGDNYSRALLWSNNAARVVDLTPPGAKGATAYGAGGRQQVGFAEVETGRIAVLWTGSAESAVSLHPGDAYTDSEAVATDGRTQVGHAFAREKSRHAMLWAGSARSAVDLNPEGAQTTYATAVDGAHQVGYCEGSAVYLPVAKAFAGNYALLWSGSARSVVNLNPEGYTDSRATGVRGLVQVGWGINALDKHFHALAWRGTPSSVTDLHAYLPEGYLYSQANGIDESGNIVGVAFSVQRKRNEPVVWSPI